MSELMNAAQVALNLTGEGAAIAMSAISETPSPQIALRAFLEERASASGAGVVHGIANGHAIAQVNVLGVLAADLKDGVHVRGKVRCPGGVGRNLVVHSLSSQERADQFPRRARGGHQTHGAIANLAA